MRVALAIVVALFALEQTRVHGPTQVRDLTGGGAVAWYAAPLDFGTLSAGACAERQIPAAGAVNGSWTLPQGCTLSVVYRNGLRQYGAVDYIVSGSELRFRDGSETTDPSEADDVVVAECK